jgi:hypothetical protein
MTPNTLIERLRGTFRVPVKDGAGLLDGKDFFERTFPSCQLAREAADEIERLTAALEGSVAVPADDAEIARLRAALDEIKRLKPEPIGDTGFVVGPLSLLNAAQRIARDVLKKPLPAPSVTRKERSTPTGEAS